MKNFLTFLLLILTILFILWGLVLSSYAYVIKDAYSLQGIAPLSYSASVKDAGGGQQPVQMIGTWKNTANNVSDYGEQFSAMGFEQYFDIAYTSAFYPTDIRFNVSFPVELTNSNEGTYVSFYAAVSTPTMTDNAPSRLTLSISNSSVVGNVTGEFYKRVGDVAFYTFSFSPTNWVVGSVNSLDFLFIYFPEVNDVINTSGAWTGNLCFAIDDLYFYTEVTDSEGIVADLGKDIDEAADRIIAYEEQKSEQERQEAENAKNQQQASGEQQGQEGLQDMEDSLALSSLQQGLTNLLSPLLDHGVTSKITFPALYVPIMGTQYNFSQAKTLDFQQLANEHNIVNVIIKIIRAGFTICLVYGLVKMVISDIMKFVDSND